MVTVISSKSLTSLQKKKYTIDLTLGRYGGLKFQNWPFYIHFLADTSSVKFVYRKKTVGPG